MCGFFCFYFYTFVKKVIFFCAKRPVGFLTPDGSEVGLLDDPSQAPAISHLSVVNHRHPGEDVVAVSRTWVVPILGLAIVLHQVPQLSDGVRVKLSLHLFHHLPGGSARGRRTRFLPLTAPFLGNWRIQHIFTGLCHSGQWSFATFRRVGSGKEAEKDK